MDYPQGNRCQVGECIDFSGWCTHREYTQQSEVIHMHLVGIRTRWTCCCWWCWCTSGIYSGRGAEPVRNSCRLTYGHCPAADQEHQQFAKYHCIAWYRENFVAATRSPFSTTTPLIHPTITNRLIPPEWRIGGRLP